MGLKKLKNKETLTLKNSIRLKIIITMITNYRNQAEMYCPLQIALAGPEIYCMDFKISFQAL